MSIENHYPFGAVTNKSTVNITQGETCWPLTILLYKNSLVSNDANIQNGIALIKDNSVIVDNIAETTNGALPTIDQLRLFNEARSLKTIYELHDFIYKYADHSRYRGTLD